MNIKFKEKFDIEIQKLYAGLKKLGCDVDIPEISIDTTEFAVMGSMTTHFTHDFICEIRFRVPKKCIEVTK